MLICCSISCGLRDPSGSIYPISGFAKGTRANKPTTAEGVYRRHHQTMDEEVWEGISGPNPPKIRIYPLQEVRMDVLTESGVTTLPISTQVSLLHSLKADL